jgi:hypothetical protein
MKNYMVRHFERTVPQTNHLANEACYLQLVVVNRAIDKVTADTLGAKDGTVVSPRR